MLSNLVNLYQPSFSYALVKAIEENNYDINKYLKWLWQTKHFATDKANFRKLHAYSKKLLIILRIGMLTEIAAGIYLIYLGLSNSLAGGIYFGIATLIVYPIVWSLLICPIVSLFKR